MTYTPDAVEVEFVRLSGETQALVTLSVHDLRTTGDLDIPMVRTIPPAGDA